MEIQPLLAIFDWIAAIVAISAVLGVGASAYGITASRAAAKKNYKLQKQALAKKQKAADEQQSFFQEAALSSQRDANLLYAQQAGRALAAEEEFDWTPWVIAAVGGLLLWFLLRK